MTIRWKVQQEERLLRGWATSSPGFTLIELMLAMTISLAMVGLIGITYTNSTKKYIHNREKSQVQMRSRLSLDFISQELRNAGYLLTWEASTSTPPLGINQVIPGATVDPGTESITVRYAVSPLNATLNGVPAGTPPGTMLPVNALPFSIPMNALVAIYSPPATTNMRRVAFSNSPGDTTVKINQAVSNTFGSGDFMTLVEENSFWIEGGNLMMRTGGSNQLLSSNVEDLQVVLIDKDENLIGETSSASFSTLTTANILDIRAVRVSLTSKGNGTLVDMQASRPPSLEDHDRSSEDVDQVFRDVESTTIYLRNFSVLNP
ncbi:MAG: prepilin-type N-terminal cleavage/methylation domain-containing protein [Nitrospiria bacterium]